MEALVLVGMAVVAIAIVAGVIAVFVKAGRQRRDVQDSTVGTDLQQLAAQHGWRYEQENVGASDRFTGPPFIQGSTGRRARDVLSGTYRDRPFSCFQHRNVTQQTGEARKTRTTYYWVFAIRTPSAKPTLQVSKESADSRFQSMFGLGDHKLGNEEFDKTFNVKTDDERFAAAVLTEPNMQWLLADQRTRELPFRFERDELVTWYFQTDRFDATKVQPTLDYLCDIQDRLAPR